MISVAAYLENEKVAELRSDYVNGRCLPLIGADPRHDLLCMRLAQVLAEHLRGSPFRLCRPPIKVHHRAAGDERFYYPDLQVGGDEGALHPDYLEAPRLILEVLSAASERRDREEKAPVYRRIEALEELVLIAHDSPRIEVWRRCNQWRPDAPVGLGVGVGILHLQSIGAPIPLEQIFR